MGHIDPAARQAYSRAYYQRTRSKQIAAAKRWNTNNSERHKTNRDAHRERAKVIVRKLKEENPCSDCKQFFPACVMDYDHVTEKNKEVSAWARSGNIEKMLKEIQKCELVCANCHRIRTERRRKDSSLTLQGTLDRVS